MGAKKNKGEGKDGGSNDSDNKKIKDAGSGGGKGNGKKEDKKEGVVVVLKMDMHCEGCAKKILKYAKSIDGVEKAKAEWESNKLTVLGDVDPAKIREDLQEKTKKKVELISPQLASKDKKEKPEEVGGKKGGGDGGGKKSQDKKGDEQKKPQEIPVIQAVLKVELHCSGCIGKIQRRVSRTKGVERVAFDKDKDLVTVTGRFDAGALANLLSDKMKRSVVVVPPKKNDKDDGKGGGGGGGGGGEKKADKKGGSKDEEEDDDDDFDDYDDDYGDYGYGGGGRFMEGRRVEYGGAGPGYGGYPPPLHLAPPAAYYGSLYGHNLHAPQIFSDENPNACSVM